MILPRKMVVEFIGTFFLMLTVGLAVATAGDLAPLAIGAALMVMVFAGGHISGGHFNPAVSTAVLLRGKLPVRDYFAYIATQAVGAILAGLVVRALGYAPANPAAVGDTGAMLVAEFLFTFALAYVVLNVATASDTEGNSFYGLAIGFTLATGAFAAGAISGGAFNPAVALGASVLGMFAWSHIWIYLLAELVGGAVAAAAFLATQPAAQQAAQPAEAHPRFARAGESRGDVAAGSASASASRSAS
jgi:aquaporin Z